MQARADAGSLCDVHRPAGWAWATMVERGNDLRRENEELRTLVRQQQLLLLEASAARPPSAAPAPYALGESLAVSLTSRLGSLVPGAQRSQLAAVEQLREELRARVAVEEQLRAELQQLRTALRDADLREAKLIALVHELRDESASRHVAVVRAEHVAERAAPPAEEATAARQERLSESVLAHRGPPQPQPAGFMPPPAAFETAASVDSDCHDRPRCATPPFGATAAQAGSVAGLFGPVADEFAGHMELAAVSMPLTIASARTRAEPAFLLAEDAHPAPGSATPADDGSVSSAAADSVGDIDEHSLPTATGADGAAIGELPPPNDVGGNGAALLSRRFGTLAAVASS